MSITLTAFPTAFLVSPDSAKGINLSKIADKIKDKGLRSLVSKFSSLQSVRVVTNLHFGEIPVLMCAFENCKKINNTKYKLSNGLNIDWVIQDSFCCAILSGNPAYKIIPKYSEEFFKVFDEIKMYNVRDISSEEYFYYNYQTEYKSIDQIKKELLSRGVTNIEVTQKNELKTKYNNQNIKYYFDKTTGSYLLEIEQKISLVNIGIEENMLSDIEIKTNIKQNELEILLQSCGYDFHRSGYITNLKKSSSYIKWELKNGTYSAKIKGISPKHIRGEIESLFIEMNKKADRDLRLLDDKTKLTYTYNTNYTDKGVLLNTLTEHGAKNIFEEGENISCELFGMIMKYVKNTDNNSYNLVIEQVSDKSQCEELLTEINEEYGLNIQEMTYKKILEHIELENMHLESEEVLEDNSIVLTIEV